MFVFEAAYLWNFVVEVLNHDRPAIIYSSILIAACKAEKMLLG